MVKPFPPLFARPKAWAFLAALACSSALSAAEAPLLESIILQARSGTGGGGELLASCTLEVRSCAGGEGLKPVSRAHRRAILAALSSGSWTILQPGGSVPATEAQARAFGFAAASTKAAEPPRGAGGAFLSAAGAGMADCRWTLSSGLGSENSLDLGSAPACPLPPPREGEGSDPLPCCLALERRDGSGWDLFSFSLARDFFPGEAAFLATALAGAPYGKRAVCLLGCFFDRSGPDWPRFRESMRALGWRLSAAEWTAYDGAAGLDAAKAGLARALMRAIGPGPALAGARVLAGSPDSSELELPLFRPADGGFRAIYGKGRPPYVEAYLSWCFDRCKPLYSRELGAELSAAGIQDRGWDGCRCITEAEGLELARAGLRYLCWGVEYSPEGGGAAPLAGRSRLYALCDVKPLAAGDLQAWAGRPAGAEAREEGYFPFSAPSSAPSQAVSDSTGNLGGRPGLGLSLPAGSAALRGFRQLAPDGIQGWPLPWAPGGFDTPKSFAAKMRLQLLARRALDGAAGRQDLSAGLKKALEPFRRPFASTLAARLLPGIRGAWTEEGFSAYAAFSAPDGAGALWRGAALSREDGSGVRPPYLGAALRPFLPGGPGCGVSGETAGGDRAGVDAPGFLSGCLAMTSLRDRVTGLDGTSRPAARLDEYGRGAASGGAQDSGLAADGLPAYLPDRLLSELADARGLGLGAADLERDSVVLPDLSLLREGDVVVSGGQEGEPFRAGIVVLAPEAGRPARGADPRSWLASVLVVSACRENGRVSLGSWGPFAPDGAEAAANPAAALPWNGFCPDPESCQARRFLVRESEAAAGSPQAEWDFLSTDADGLWVDLSFAERWIPNTGQFLRIDSVCLDGSLGGRRTGLLFGSAYAENRVLPAGGRDRHRGSACWAGANSAGSSFALYAFDGDPESGAGVPLVALVMDGEGNYAARAAAPAGSGAFSSAVYREDFSLLPGWKSRADERGRFVVEGGGRTYASFGIRPLFPGAAAFGDDILLSFRMERGGRSLWGEAQPGQYLAAYDKKLLSRANLYVDEGEGDWNDEHPWNAPPLPSEAASAPWWWSEAWGYNEWNMYRNATAEDPSWTSTGQDPSTLLDAELLEATYRPHIPSGSAAPIPGGQVVRFNPWDAWNGAAHTADSPAYSWSGEDSPFEFDEELLEQKALIAARRNADAAAQASGGTSSGSSCYQLLPWALGGAPAGSWDDYLFPLRHTLSLSGLGDTCSYAGTAPPQGDGASQHPWTLPEGTLASIPGLTTFLAFSADLAPERNPGNALVVPHIEGTKRNFYPDRQTPYSSGIDCSGFVWRSLSYAGNRYAVRDRISTTEFADTQYVRAIVEAGPNDEDHVAGLDELVPGDILLWKGSHIVMILDIDVGPLGTVDNKKRVRVIQSGAGAQKEYQVMTNRSWFDDSSGLSESSAYSAYRPLLAQR